MATSKYPHGNLPPILRILVMMVKEENGLSYYIICTMRTVEYMLGPSFLLEFSNFYLCYSFLGFYLGSFWYSGGIVIIR